MILLLLLITTAQAGLSIDRQAVLPSLFRHGSWQHMDFIITEQRVVGAGEGRGLVVVVGLHVKGRPLGAGSTAE